MLGDVEGLGGVELAAGDMTLCVGEGVGVSVEAAALPHPAASMTAATITASAAPIILVFTGLIYPCAIVVGCEVAARCPWRVGDVAGEVRPSRTSSEEPHAGRSTSRPPMLTRQGQRCPHRADGVQPRLMAIIPPSWRKSPNRARSRSFPPLRGWPAPAAPCSAPPATGGGTAGFQDALLLGFGVAALLAGAGSLAYRRRLTRKR